LVEELRKKKKREKRRRRRRRRCNDNDVHNILVNLFGESTLYDVCSRICVCMM
jgi:hypothetical protein